MTLTFSKAKMLPLKAVLIFIIVLGHFVYYSESPVFSIFHELGTSAVAMFFFVSGFGCLRSWQRKGQDYLKGFFRSRILGILLPAIAFFVFHCIWRKDISTPPQYWFLWVILFDYFLFWCCYRFLPPVWRIPALLTGCLAFIAITYLTGLDRCWWVCGLAFPTGCLFAEIEESLARACSDKPIRFWGWLSAGVLLFVGAYLTRKPLVWTLCYAGISWVLALLVAIVPYDKWKLPVLGFLGAISYEIYLSHITVMEIVQSSRILSANIWVFFLKVLLTTILISLCINRLCKLILHR